MATTGTQENLQSQAADAPLAYRIRPRHLTGFFGQSHLLGAGSALRNTLKGGALHSMIFWGSSWNGQDHAGYDAGPSTRCPL